MFEQEIHNQGTPSQNSPEPPLFKDYEMRSWKFSTRIYQIFAVSLLFNIIAIFGLGQSNLLTVKGCDSPLIGGVCQVLDTVYVGSRLFGTDSEYINEAYTPTEIGPNDEITYIEVKEEPLYYPANYFEIANANDPKVTELAGIPGISDGPIAPLNPTFPSSGIDLAARPQVTPTPNSNLIDGDLPLPDEDDDKPAKTPPLGSGRTSKGPKGVRNGTIPVIPNVPQKPTPAKAPPLPSLEDLTTIVINRRPLDDLGAIVNDLLAKNQVDLLAKVNVMAKGKLTEDGKIDINTFKFAADDRSDKAMVDVIQKAILSLSDSGYLQYLSTLSGKDINMSMVQDDQNFTAVVESEVESKARAASLQFILNQAIKFYKDKKSGPGADQNDQDDLALLNTASVEVDGKKIIIKFVVPRSEAQALIKNKLKIKPPTEPAKPQSTAQNGDSNTNTGK